MSSSLACISCRSLFLGSVLLLAITSRAAAQDSSAVPDGGAPSVAADYPLANAQRPLTLRARLLPIAAVLGFRQTCASSLGSSGCWDKLLSIGGGLAYGDSPPLAWTVSLCCHLLELTAHELHLELDRAHVVEG
jgi:hypothetical protein